MVCGVGIVGALTGCVDSGTDTAADGGSTGSGPVSGTAATLGTTGETGTVPLGCGDNLLEDPGFEAGLPNGAWDDVSPLFDTPICNSDCTDDVGAGPFVGDWWVWFGGIAMADTPSVKQTVLIPDGLAMLRFGFSINAGSGTGNDVFTVSIDQDPVVQILDTDASDYSGWRVLEVDVSRFADGGEHELEFSAVIAGEGVTNFFVDEVELLPCDESSESSSEDSGSSSGDTNVGDSSTGQSAGPG